MVNKTFNQSSPYKMDGLLRTVMFIAFLISIPIYVLYLGTLIRFRNKKPFSTPFFTICLTLGFLDIIGLLNTWFLTYFPIYGWFGMDHVVKRWPRVWAKVFKTVGFWNGFGGTMSVFIMAFNRMTNIAFPLRHQLIWNSHFIKFVIFLQLGLPAIMSLPCLAMEFDYHMTNGSDSLGPTKFLNMKYHVIYYSTAFIYIVAANVASFVMYMILFCKNRVSKVTPHNNSNTLTHGSGPNHTEELLRKVQKKMVIFGLVMFLLLSLITVYMALMITAKDPAKLAIYLQLRAVFVDIYTWINPYLALALSQTVREHFKAFILCRQIEEEKEVIQMNNKVRQQLQPRPARIIVV